MVSACDRASCSCAGLSVGRYWTPNLKTEVEVMTSTEGLHYAQRMVTQADGGLWPYGAGVVLSLFAIALQFD